MIAHKPAVGLAILAVVTLTAGCSWGPVVDDRQTGTRPVAAPADDRGDRDHRPPPSDIGSRVAHYALEQQGVPYRYGGETPQGFDCSGLVHYAYGRAGKAVPRTTTALHGASVSVPRDSLRAGDLVFFRIDGKMAHVGIYLDGNRFVHAPQSGRVVSVGNLESPFYRQAFLRGGRLP